MSDLSKQPTPISQPGFHCQNPAGPLLIRTIQSCLPDSPVSGYLADHAFTLKHQWTGGHLVDEKTVMADDRRFLFRLVAWFSWH